MNAVNETYASLRGFGYTSLDIDMFKLAVQSKGYFLDSAAEKARKSYNPLLSNEQAFELMTMFEITPQYVSFEKGTCEEANLQHQKMKTRRQIVEKVMSHGRATAVKLGAEHPLVAPLVVIYGAKSIGL